jgi:hypothetical protein
MGEGWLSEAKIRVLNNLGQVVYQTQVHPKVGSLELQLGDLAAGIYYLRVNDNRNTTSQRIIIAR